MSTGLTLAGHRAHLAGPRPHLAEHRSDLTEHRSHLAQHRPHPTGQLDPLSWRPSPKPPAEPSSLLGLDLEPEPKK